MTEQRLDDADNGEYSDKKVDLAVRPKVAVWREAVSGSGEDKALVCYIVDELMRTTIDVDRESIFRMMRYDEAERLRRTGGLAEKIYAGYFLKKRMAKATKLSHAALASRSEMKEKEVGNRCGLFINQANIEYE